MAPTTIYCIRHGQAWHNLHVANHAIRDPSLTSWGEHQCHELSSNFPHKTEIDLIVASPIVRTLNTALLTFEDVIKSKNLKVLALPELQETSDLPCDTGIPPEELAKKFEGQPVDLSLVKPGWESKQGKFATTAVAIEARAREARQWVAARPEKVVVVVTHGGFLHTFAEDWTGADRFPGLGWANCECREYGFNNNISDPRFVETAESRRSRLGDARPLDREEQTNLKRSLASQ